MAGDLADSALLVKPNDLAFYCRRNFLSRSASRQASALDPQRVPCSRNAGLECSSSPAGPKAADSAARETPDVEDFSGLNGTEISRR
jgi:hypothetical protein